MRDLNRYKPPPEIESLPAPAALTDEDLGLAPREAPPSFVDAAGATVTAEAIEVQGDISAESGDWPSACRSYGKLAGAGASVGSPLFGLKLACALRGVGDLEGARLQYARWSLSVNGDPDVSMSDSVGTWLDRWEALGGDSLGQRAKET